MPRGDGTGPIGMGPMTGRRAGLCVAETNVQGPLGAFGCRRGVGGIMRGVGSQARNRVMAQAGLAANAPGGNEKELLTKQLDFLAQQLQQVKQRLDKIDAKSE